MSEIAALCRKLLHADTEAEVITILMERGYWDKPELWRPYGDIENNWGQSGNQQSFAEAALAEKVVNSIDARLINECKERRICPESERAPHSIREAVAQFFDNSTGEKVVSGGYIEDWDSNKTRKIADGITLCATGRRPDQLNITIADCGEGQTPDRLPETILSLSKSNKQCIPFVQGQFNQGGTGALRFCGKENLQLVISRRNPAILDCDASDRDREWCFTIVRREVPNDMPGARRNSFYSYLAPVGINLPCEERRGGILSFAADTFLIYPNDDGPYCREASFGTAIKMYEYNYTGNRSNILRDSLLSRIDLLLPEIALPISFYEYRTDKFGRYFDGSRRRTVSGILRRMQDSENLEKGFPVKIPFQPDGEKLMAQIFAFVPRGSTRGSDSEGSGAPSKKLGGARSYRKREGVVFLHNGQAQGNLPKDFFRRDAVKMRPLVDDLLIFVECDNLKSRTREDLFMSSRDRLVDNEFKQELVSSLERAISNCSELKSLRNKRQQQRVNERLQDDKPLTDVLQSLIKNSPNLKNLLILGQRISAPFETKPTGSSTENTFVGEFYPTFFKNKGVAYGQTLSRMHPIKNRMRLTFETNACNNYFTRSADRAEFRLVWKDSDGGEHAASLTGPNLKNGIATVMVKLPNGAKIGDKIEFIARTHDSSQNFENYIEVEIQTEAKEVGGGKGKRKPPKENGDGGRERPNEMDPPAIERIFRDDWDANQFTELTAMKINIEYEGENDKEKYVFKVNMNNNFLENEIKNKRLSEDASGSLREQFLYANVLIGLSLLHENKLEKRNEDVNQEKSEEDIEERVERTCRALAPFIPALVTLGSSDLEADDGIDGDENVD